MLGSITMSRCTPSGVLIHCDQCSTVLVLISQVGEGARDALTLLQCKQLLLGCFLSLSCGVERSEEYLIFARCTVCGAGHGDRAGMRAKLRAAVQAGRGVAESAGTGA